MLRLMSDSSRNGCVTLAETSNVSESHFPCLQDEKIIAASEACWKIKYKTPHTLTAIPREIGSQSLFFLPACLQDV